MRIQCKHKGCLNKNSQVSFQIFFSNSFAKKWRVHCIGQTSWTHRISAVSQVGSHKQVRSCPDTISYNCRGYEYITNNHMHFVETLQLKEAFSCNVCLVKNRMTTIYLKTTMMCIWILFKIPFLKAMPGGTYWKCMEIMSDCHSAGKSALLFFFVARALMRYKAITDLIIIFWSIFADVSCHFW